MKQLRKEVRLVRDGILPLTGDLASLLWDLKVYEEELSRDTEQDLLRLQSYFPSFRPFSGVADVQERILTIRREYAADASRVAFLDGLVSQLDSLRKSTDLRKSIEDISDPTVQEALGSVSDEQTNEQLYDTLARAFVAALYEHRIEKAQALKETLASIIRNLRHEVASVRRSVGRFVAEADHSAEVAKARTQLMLSITAGLALALALGVMIWVGLTLTPLRRLREGVRRVARGDFRAVTVRTTDEIGQLAEDFNRMAVSLEQRDRQLARQREELLRSERLATIGKVSAQITHEIRNPLSSIGLNTELLEDELDEIPANSEVRQLLSAIRGEIDRLTGVTEQYLQFARLPRLQRSVEDLNQLIQDLIDFMRPELMRNQVNVTFNSDESVLSVRLDGKQIRQSLLNLIRNAIDSMPDGGEVQIHTSWLGDGVELVVQDSGVGINADTLPRIFDPFFSTKDTGTGLGLALVQQIVHEHEGSIRCESEPGQGTQFMIALPSSGNKDISD